MRLEYVAVGMIIFLVVLAVVISFASGVIPTFNELLVRLGFRS